MSSTQRATDSTRPTVRTLLTAEDVAQMTGMDVDWIYAQARLGRIPTVRLGRYWRFRLEAIEQWVRDLETDARRRSTLAGRSGRYPILRACRSGRTEPVPS